MPDTTGTVANLAEFRGQTLHARPGGPEELHEAALLRHDGRRHRRRRLHAQVRRRPRRDRARSPSRTGAARPRAPAHVAIGPLSGRYPPTGRRRRALLDLPRRRRQPGADAQARVGHAAAQHDSGGATRALPDGADARGVPGTFEMPDLTGVNQFPNDDERRSPASRSPASRRRAAGTRPRRGSRSRPRRGRGLRRRADPVPDQRRDAAVLHRAVQPDDRGRDHARVPLDRPRRQRRDASRASSSRSTPPRPPPRPRPSRTDVAEGGWHDQEVTVGLRAGDGPGSGTEKIEYRVNPRRAHAPWLTYDAAFDVGGEGADRRRVPLHRRRRQRRGRRS